jgi:tetratricopeptide (TPR) repeat protein
MQIRKTTWLYLTLLPAMTGMLGFYSCKPKEKVTASSTQSTRSSSKDNGKKLSEADQIKFTEWFFNASKEKMLGNYELAAAHFERCIQIDPENGAPYYELAQLYNQQGNPKMGLAMAQKAVEKDPSNLWYNRLLGESYMRAKSYDKAASLLEGVVKKNPERIDLYYDLANAYIYGQKYKDAISVFDRIEKQIGISEDVSMQKLKLYKEIKDSKSVIDELNKLIAAFPAESRYYGMLGEYYQERGEKEKAFEAYNKVLSIAPDDPYVHLFLADYYRSVNQDDKSFGELKLAFRNTSLDVDTKVKILRSYFSITEKFDELKKQAFELCEILTEVHPNDAVAHAMYGDFLYREKNLEKARDEFRKAIALDKEKYALWSQLLIIESQLNDYQAMFKESKEAIELFPNQPIAYLLNGISNLQMKKYQEAIDVMEEGRQYVISDKQLLSEFHSNLGEAYYRLKNNQKSDENFESALANEPDNIFVLNNYSYYLSLRNEKLERAKEMSKRSNELEPGNSSYQDTYGWILYQMGNFAEAKIWIQKAIDSGGKNNGVILEHFGDVLFKLGDKENALKYWNEAKIKGDGSDLLDKKLSEKKLFE